VNQGDPVRIGMIGGGGIAAQHLSGYLAIPEGARVSAVADIDPERARIHADRAGSARVFTDYREMLASSLVDAVDICLPHHLHAEAIVAAAEAGLHVLCEKPLCLTIEEADRVHQAVTAAGITLMCSHNQLFLPPVAEARRLLDQGILGPVYQARTTDSFFNDFDPSTMGWRAHRSTSGGGELIDTGYHPTYLLLYLLDGEPTEVTAMLSRHRLTFMEGEDSAEVLVRFAGGSVGTITTSWAYEPAGSTERFSVVGEGGALWSDGSSLWHRPRGGETVEVLAPTGRKVDTIALSVQEFVACLREGRRPIHTEVEGIAVLKVILGAYASGDQGRTIPLPTFQERGRSREAGPTW
jgi:predicted dehydrogenase